MQADKNQSSLKIEGNSNGSTKGLAFISTLEKAKTSCSREQPGTIAPTGSGMPVVCVSINGAQNWKALGSGDFTQTSEGTYTLGPVGSGGTGLVQNTSSNPEFISTDCPTGFGLGADNYGTEIDVYGNNNGQPSISPISWAFSQFEYVGLIATKAGAFSVSAIVPPGDWWGIDDQDSIFSVLNAISCNYMITQ